MPIEPVYNIPIIGRYHAGYNISTVRDLKHVTVVILDLLLYTILKQGNSFRIIHDQLRIE